MKKTLFTLTFLAIVATSVAQVAINTSGATPNSHAMLDVTATDMGVLIPRLTTANRTGMALTSTEDGLTVYDTDTKSFWYWNGTDWSEMAAGNVSDADWFKQGTTDAPTDIDDDMFHTGNVAIGKNTADTKLDVYDTSHATTMQVNNANADNTLPLKIAGSFNINGVAPTSTGLIGVYASVGGDPGSGYKPLTGFEADMAAQAGVNPYQYGFVSDLSGDSDKSYVGVYNYIHNTNGSGMRYGVFNWIEGASSGHVYSNYTLIQNNGDGIHFGSFKRILGTGNGAQYGDFNRIANSGNGKQIGVVNEIKNAGTALHVGTANVVGAGVTEADPAHIVPITNDSDGKRVGSMNVVAGNGGGQHAAELNAVISTGDGVHVGVGNVLGYDYVNQTFTTTSGYHIGSINNLNDLGDGDHAGGVNVLGAVVDPNNPLNIIPVSGDSNARRLGSSNLIAGDGGGTHGGAMNMIISTGNGKHIGLTNILGYNYLTSTAYTSQGDHLGVLNNLNDLGAGKHIGTMNMIGYDNINNTEVNSDGIHIGGMNFLAGGVGTNNGIQGLQAGQVNVIYTKSDVNSIFQGKQFGSLNVIGKDPLNPLGPAINGGDGDHFASFNEVDDTGNGDHIASYNKVGADGTGRHIAVYAEVDAADTAALAGAFKGYTTAHNQVSTINLYSSNEYNVTNTSWQDLTFMEAGMDPSMYNKLGAVEVKVFVRVSYASGSNNKFRLRAQNSVAAVTVISDTDTWTWTETDTTNHKYVITSQWKQWMAGTSPWELHLEGITDANMKIVNVYVMVRPMQL